MDIGLVLFSAVSAISSSFLAVLVFQAKKDLSSQAKRQMEAYDTLRQELVNLSRSQTQFHKQLENNGSSQTSKLQEVCKQLESVDKHLVELKDSLEESVKF